MVRTDPHYRIAELMAHEPVFSDETIAEAAEQVNHALRDLALSHSVAAGYIMSLTRRVYTSAVPTLAVELAGDGIAILEINADYAIKLGHEGLRFVLAHEAYHLLLKHLHVDVRLNKNPNWTMAEECVINHFVSQLLGTQNTPASMPQIKNEKGEMEEQGVNPKTLWTKYKDNLKKEGLQYVAYDDFVRTDLGCFAELERMSKPPKMKNPGGCTRGVGEPGAGDGQGNGTGHIDPAANDLMMSRTLGHLMHEAGASGNLKARAELLALEERTEGSDQASKIWGDLGVGSLRGETVSSRRTDYWQQYLCNALAERLIEGEKLLYMKKRAAMPETVPRLARRGEEYERKVLFAIDASGSMRSSDLKWIADRLGEMDNTQVELVSFDGVIWPFKLGEHIQGGGGTNFDIIEEYVSQMEEQPDAVLVVTDGYASHMVPSEPDRWIWLITPGGDTWPETLGMTTFEIDTVDSAAA